MIVNKDIALEPLNWIVIGLMLAVFLFVVASIMPLFTQGQNVVSTTIGKAL
jgi:hypothetical protein